MSVHIRPHYASIGVPQWRHNAARVVANLQLPDMSGVTITADGTDYDIYLPDSVWLTIYEDLGEHFARKDAQAEAEETYVEPLPIDGTTVASAFLKAVRES